jgi:arabinofuranosyltransferase
VTAGTAAAPGQDAPVALAGPPRSRRRRRDPGTALLLVPVAFLMVMGWTRRWVFEDAFLNFRIVDQIRAGNGPVFNIGERVETATSTAWLALLVVLRTLAPFMAIEWLSVVAGLLLTGLGLWLAQLAARRLWSRDVRSATVLFVPFGALVYAALPAAWDWATSGLENGLSVAWLGAVAYVLCTYGADRAPAGARRTIFAGVVVGFGVLVRPDLAIMSATALAAVLWVRRPSGRALGELLAGAGGLPVLYEVFRASYYGTLVPNTALAKNAGTLFWADGWNSFLDFVAPYWLIVPVALAVVAGVVAFRRVTVRPALATVCALPAGGLLHAAYLTLVGGDYLHARLFLPSLFALLVPVMALPWSRWMLVPMLGLVAWFVVTVGWLRVEHGTGSSASLTPRLVADAPALMRTLAKPGHDPILATDFELADGSIARRLQARGERALVTGSATGKPPLLDATPERTTLISVASGLSGYRAGVDVVVQEAQSLADPYGSRMPVITPSSAGHRKRESWEWMIAMRTLPGVTAGYDRREIAAARRALGCGALAALDRATTAPLTPGRLWSNLTGSIGRTRLEIPRDPVRAEQEFCGSHRRG